MFSSKLLLDTTYKLIALNFNRRLRSNIIFISSNHPKKYIVFLTFAYSERGKYKFRNFFFLLSSSQGKFVQLNYFLLLAKISAASQNLTSTVVHSTGFPTMRTDFEKLLFYFPLSLKLSNIK